MLDNSYYKNVSLIISIFPRNSFINCIYSSHDIFYVKYTKKHFLLNVQNRLFYLETISPEDIIFLVTTGIAEHFGGANEYPAAKI